MNKTNTARAIRAEKVLKQYLANLDGTESDEFTLESLAMLLCEIQHACDKNDVPFYEAVSLAKASNHAERCGIDNYLDEPGAVEEFPFTVVLRYPEYMNESNANTYSWTGFAPDMQAAVAIAQAEAEGGLNPADFELLIALEGICKFLN